MASRNTIHVLAIVIGGRSEKERNGYIILLISTSNICRTPSLGFVTGFPLRRPGLISELIKIGFTVKLWYRVPSAFPC
jgi:hypothetical protein